MMSLSNSAQAKLAGVLNGALLVVAALMSPSALAKTPAQEALEQVRATDATKDVVQNRFFLKEERFEIAPVLGVVPNNPMVQRYVGGVLVAYHLSETLSMGGTLLYSPDLGTADLKDLANTLVVIAHTSTDNTDFQQPLDKMVLGATFSANWAPVYGKINLVGATVVNFDFYGTAGVGMLTLAEYYAQWDDDLDAQGVYPPVSLGTKTNLVKPTLNLGIGMDFFLNQSVALKLDARSFLYVGREPDYTPLDDSDAQENRVYNNFLASAGVSMYFPTMKPRVTNF